MKQDNGWSTGLEEQHYRVDPAGAATHAVVMRYHQAWRRHDIDALMALFDPQVEYNDFFQGRRIAPAELRDFLLAGMPASGDENQLYCDRLRVDGDTAFLQYQVTLRGTEGLVSFRACEALTVRDGRIVQVNEHTALLGQREAPSGAANPRVAVSRLGLSARQLGLLAGDIQQYFEQGQPYLNPDLDMPQVAAATGYTRNQISFLLNQVLGCSFYQHLNQLRLKHLLAQLEVAGAATRIDELAREAGFRSLSTFYRCFREETGLSPKAWLERRAAG
ncbi:nuclear transport factor 2 family protein [Pseudomonas citronellolis]|uniref:nuclear transport factor 2 family protein n=1 Tax=Pseudomonas citronellolis TaxID=53408 RepID=UPI0023E36EFF|nr:nuclear transport factor 2 family protein [Pseudomonas citronellolis]MDF3935622.1 nuclear transport factor 2 family protein [Pseudomonas citronellolis]